MRRFAIAIALSGYAAVPAYARGPIVGANTPVVQNSIACKSLADIDHMWEIYDNNDIVPGQIWLRDKMQKGECVPLVEGTTVLVENLQGSKRTPLSCVRPQGKPSCYWTPDASLDQK
jgi:hypothetical protein